MYGAGTALALKVLYDLTHRPHSPFEQKPSLLRRGIEAGAVGLGVGGLHPVLTQNPAGLAFADQMKGDASSFWDRIKPRTQPSDPPGAHAAGLHEFLTEDDKK
jgi:hypothetical protein